MSKAILIVAMAGAAALLLMPRAVPPEDAEDEPDYESTSLIDEATGIAQEVIDMAVITEGEEVKEANLQAFLWMLRVSEGTDGPDGYRTIVGGSLFDSYADHPRVLVALPRLGIKSSAAGAFQILRRTWDEIRDSLDLPDFSPESQDAAAVALIRRRGALADVKAGRFAVAVEKCKKEWASLPGAGYGQHENSLARLQSAYTVAGGYIA